MTRSQMLCWGIAGALTLLLGTSMPAWAQAEADEGRLDATHKAIDKEATSKGSADRIQGLSRQFNVPPSQIEGMRAQKQGWGEITIQLAMAEHLTKTDAQAYPTMNEALAKIQTLRNDGAGWGKIAKDLGFKLGPVVRDAERARQDLAKETRTERAERLAKQERPERPDRPTRPERPERPERMGRK